MLQTKRLQHWIDWASVLTGARRVDLSAAKELLDEVAQDGPPQLQSRVNEALAFLLGVRAHNSTQDACVRHDLSIVETLLRRHVEAEEPPRAGNPDVMEDSD